MNGPFAFLRKSEFVTTEMLEIAIAPEAKIGLIHPIMATGIKTILYAKAQNKLSLIVFIVCLDSLIAETTDIKFLLTPISLSCRTSLAALAYVRQRGAADSALVLVARTARDIRQQRISNMPV